MIGQGLPGNKYFQFIILTSGQKNCQVLKRRVCQRQTRKEKMWLRLRERLKLVIPRQKKRSEGVGVRNSHHSCSAAGVCERDLDLQEKKRLVIVPVLPALRTVCRGAARHGLAWLLGFDE